MAEQTQSPCFTTQLAGCSINQHKGHPQDSPQVLPFQQHLPSNLEVRKKWKEKGKKKIVTDNPRARACPLAQSLKSERQRWDKKRSRQFCCGVFVSHPVPCLPPVLTPWWWLQAVTGISDTLMCVTQCSHALVDCCSKALTVICTKLSRVL